MIFVILNLHVFYFQYLSVILIGGMWTYVKCYNRKKNGAVVTSCRLVMTSVTSLYKMEKKSAQSAKLNEDNKHLMIRLAKVSNSVIRTHVPLIVRYGLLLQLVYPLMFGSGDFEIGRTCQMKWGCSFSCYFENSVVLSWSKYCRLNNTPLFKHERVTARGCEVLQTQHGWRVNSVFTE